MSSSYTEMTSPHTTTTARRVRFDAFEFDMETGELRKGGLRVLLQPQPATLLSVLLSPPGELVRRERIRQALWGDDTTVDFELGMNRCVRQLRAALLDNRGTPRYIETLARRGYRFVAPVSALSDPLVPIEIARPSTAVPTSSIAPEPLPSIVVLPFANLSGNPEDEYFSDGLTEEIINGLTQIGGLKVISRTSAFAFKGKNDDIRQIAEALGVSMVLEGSVRRAGDRMRITSQLIRAADGAHLSSKRYDTELIDIFETQDKISIDIATQLKVRLVLRPHPTTNLGAYEAFLEGRYHWHKFSPAGFIKALECYNRAVAIDPDYGPAYTGIAEFYFGLCLDYASVAQPALTMAMTAAERAVELNEIDGEAHAALAYITIVKNWDWEMGHQHLLRALDLNPSSHVVRFSDAFWRLLPYGRRAEALAQVDRAVEEDPLLALGQSFRAAALLYSNEFEAAEKAALRSLELDPYGPNALQILSFSYAFRGRHDEALVRANQLSKVHPNSYTALNTFGVSYALAENRTAAYAVIDGMKSRPDCIQTCATGPAFIYALLGDKDDAFEWLGRAVDFRDHRVAWVNCHPCAASLKADPRFEDLLRRINLLVPAA
jgi:TolB-like protein